MHKLAGKRAVITGGSSGIGLATAKLFVSEGASVVVTGRRQKELDDAVREIGDPAVGIQGDISKLADLDRIFATAGPAGRIDILFANAGIMSPAPLATCTEDQYDMLIDTNIKGTLFTVQKALPLMNDGGSIILTGSVASVKGTSDFGIYGASKAAVRSFARTLTMELKGRGIRANVICPGPIDTPLLADASPEQVAPMLATIPMGRIGRDDEVARAALFLGSDDASFITGIELFVDGGRAQV